jgi:toxin ParE1/3/4
VAKLIKQCQRIGNALMGYVGRADLAPDLRMAALERNVIFCRVIEGVVRIERVLHGARNLPAVLERNNGAVLRTAAARIGVLSVLT